MTEETMFEAAGGAGAFLHLPRRFYAQVAADPVLAPVFAGMTDAHAEGVALWLGEVFGGPKRYSAEHGGNPHMVSRHVGRALTEEQRARWPN